MIDNKEQRYFRILEDIQQLWQIAKKIEEEYPATNVVERVMAQVGGPVIYLYVAWVIQEALARKIRRLYFLARDGQIFYEVAKLICHYEKLDLECRYLYCSRLAWRVPRYWLMGEKCLDYICQRSMNLTIRKIFDRTLLSEEKVTEISKEMGFAEAEMNRILDYGEINIIREKLRVSSIFMQSVYEESQKQYENTRGYLKQEGLCENVKFAIVDTGWVGNMQQSLCDLLRSKDLPLVKVEGFYFGMFRQTKLKKQFYHAYLFAKNSGFLRKIVFNNNLLECMCGATDGMTVKYMERNGAFYPYFASKRNINSGRWNIKENHRIICRFAEQAGKKYGMIRIPYKESVKISSRLMRKFMMLPTSEEAEQFGRYLFSDDVTEKGVRELAPYLTQRELLSEDFIPKVLKRLFVKKTIVRQTKSYWIEGSISRSKTCLASWHRLNGMIWHLLQFL